MDSRAVAKRLGITISAVNRLAARGTLPSIWHAGRRMFKKAAIDAYCNDSAAQKRRPPDLRLVQGDLDFSLSDALRRVRQQAIGRGKKS